MLPGIISQGQKPAGQETLTHDDGADRQWRLIQSLAPNLL